LIETRANFGFMLVGLILLWSTAPIASLATGAADTILYVALGAALCLGAWSLAREAWFFAPAATLIVLAVICAIIALFTGNVLAIYLTLILQILFWAMCAWFVGRHVLATGPVDTNRIAGAICVYLIAATMWALLFVLLNQINPDSFHGLENLPFEDQFAELMYFSTVTLTTLGYGDITPASPYARWLTQVEAVFGQLYIAILIAALVGNWIALAAIKGTSDDDLQR
jgi:hypothetical protein